MQLGEPEAIGVLDDHDGRVRDVDPQLHDGRGDQDVDLAVGERPQRPLLVRRAEGTVQEPHPRRGELAPEAGVVSDRRHRPEAPGRLAHRTDHERLAPLPDRVAQARVGRPAPVGSLAHQGGRGGAPRGALGQEGGVQIAVQREGEAARDRRRRHREQVRRARPTASAQPGALRDAEAVLLVGDHQPEPRDVYAGGEQRLRPDEERHPTRGRVAQDRRARGRRGPPGERGEPKPHPRRQRPEGPGLLLGERLGRDHHEGRAAGRRDQRRGREGHRRLAAADVADQEPLHRARTLEVAGDFGQGLPLRGRERERQRRLEARPRRRGDLGPDADRRRPGRRPTMQERELPDHQVLERDAPARARELLRRRGIGRRVDEPERLGEPRQPEPRPRRRRKQLRRRVAEAGEGRGGEPLEDPPRHPFDGRVPRPDAEARLPAPGQRRREDRRVHELPRPVLCGANGAGQRDRAPLDEGLRHRRPGPEPARPDGRRRAVRRLDEDVEQPPREHVHAANRPAHERHRPLGNVRQRSDGRRLPEIVVATRQAQQQNRAR